MFARAALGQDPAKAEGLADNAVAAAEDAFGIALGREQLGLYESGDVRGFSPLAAGNARIEGLYFDPVSEPNARLAASTTIKVGISAQGSPLIAPTGLVSYGLRRPGVATTASILAGADAWGSASLEMDGALPITESLALGFGGAFGRQKFGDGTRETTRAQALIIDWRLDDDTEAVGFWSGDKTSDAIPSPVSLSDLDLPPVGTRRQFDGPAWARVEQTKALAGLIFKAEIAPGLRLHRCFPFSPSKSARPCSTENGLRGRQFSPTHRRGTVTPHQVR